MFLQTKLKFGKYLIIGVTSCMFAVSSIAFSEPINVDISYIKLTQESSPSLSNIFKTPEDTGYSGARLAINDSNTTGKFLKQHFDITNFSTKKKEKLLTYINDEYNKGRSIFILDVPSTQLEKINVWAKN